MLDVTSSPTTSVHDRTFEAIVMGGSAGALQVLKPVLSALSDRVSFPVIIVVHVPADRPSALIQVLEHGCSLRIKEGEDKEKLAGGTVYLAPPGYHLYVETDRSLSLSSDEPVHYSRPSIDVLFESAADAYGRGLLGILLSGGNPDGAAGLSRIRQLGGTTVVQTPASAEVKAMPESALRAHTPNAVLTPEQIAQWFSQLEGTARGGARV